MTTTPAEKKTVSFIIRVPRHLWWIRELAALSLWGFVFVQLWLWDVLGEVVRYFPQSQPLVRYRILVALAVVGLNWLFGTRYLLAYTGYIVTYPLVVLLWRVPILSFRHWPLVLAFLPGIESLIVTAKFSFLLFITAVITSAVILFSDNDPAIVTSMVFLAVCLCIHFWKRFRSAFTPSTVFKDWGERLRTAWMSFSTTSSFGMPAGVTREDPEYEKKVAGNILVGYTVVTGLAIFGERLQVVSRSRWLDVYALASLLHTALITTVCFAVELNGLERLRPGSFVALPDPTFLTFLGLSFSTLTNSGISPLKPATGLAQVALHVEVACALIILAGVLAFLALTSRRERYREDLDTVVKDLQLAEKEMAQSLERNFSLTMARLEQLLLQQAAPLVKWLIRKRYGEQRAIEIIASAEQLKDQTADDTVQ